MTSKFKCNDCGEFKPVQTEGGTGYARLKDGSNICYECCGIRDRADMVKTGRGVLYLSSVPAPDCMKNQPWNTIRGRLSNWPGTLEFKVDATKKGRHNMAGSRYDVWFTGPDGKDWHGVQYGENTQICHCRRIK